MACAPPGPRLTAPRHYSISSGADPIRTRAGEVSRLGHCSLSQLEGGPDDVKMLTVPLVAAGAMAVFTWSTASHAAGSIQPPTSAEVPPPVVYRHPNSSFLGKGVFAFIGAYFPSVLVAIVNDNSYDKRLYLPILGPWLDLADRPGCGGPGQSTCGAETAFKILLITSGAAQGFGALAIVLGLALPERIVTQPPPTQQAGGLHLRVLPASLGRGGYGIKAVGTF